MYQHILLPTDLGNRSWVAADTVRDLARSDPHPTVTLLHVIQTVAGATFEELQSLYTDLEARSRTKLDALGSYLANAGIASTQQVVYGRPAEEIVSFATEHGVDLVVLASHPIDPGRPGGGWGTLSYKVGLLAPCSVLLAKERP